MQLILLHGATLNGRMWDPVRRELDPAYKVVAPDLPGHGARRAERYTLAAAVETVRQCAAAYPAGRLKGLVLGGSSANLVGRHLLPYYARMATFRLLITLFGEPRLVAALLPRKLRQMGITEADAEALLAAGIQLGAFGQAVQSLSKFDFRRNLAHISQPILFVNGDQDRGMVAQEASFVAAARAAQAHRFDRCGHGVSLLRPAEFAALVNRFVAEVCAT